MPDIGKFAQGLRGFPAPEAASEVTSYLLFYFPDEQWAQYVIGAAKALTYAYNWYDAGGVSPDEAAAAFRDIVDAAPYNLKTCSNPAGGKIIRVAPDGNVEELSDLNTWQEPTGDYTIPPVPARTDGSPPDQICLAAKNAANVLQLLYENVTDSFNNDLDEAEAATALTLTLVGLVGAEFAPITFALITFFGIVFSVLYGLLEFIGADLWDSAFTESLVCILYGCASNDAGVVTFDYECFNNALAAQVTIDSLTFDQLRLFGQIQYLLLVIGGVDALNQAGATTAITDDNCDPCVEHCFELNFLDDDGTGFGFTIQGGTWEDGLGWKGQFGDSNNRSDVYGYWAFGVTVNADKIQMEYTKSGGSGTSNVNAFQKLSPATSYNATILPNQNNLNTFGEHLLKEIDANEDIQGMGFDINSGQTATDVYCEKLRVFYFGDIPSGWSDNCT